MMTTRNPVGLDGLEWVELSGPNPAQIRQILRDFGFSYRMRHATRNVELWHQHDIQFLLNTEPGSFAAAFQDAHGPCIASLGWRVDNANAGLAEAVRRGAKAERGDYQRNGETLPALSGIGGSLIYLVDDRTPLTERYARLGFVTAPDAEYRPDKGFLLIDHLTNNVARGTMKPLADFYKDVFGFTEVRYFDISGVQTGLTSYALRSPCGRFCIPINEGREDASQIDEYLREYRGPGVQHLAFLTEDILASLDAMQGSTIATLDIDDDYYATVFDRVPGVVEDRARIRAHDVLVDGDADGYLLQIFTKNLLGPIFIEIIQRRNHHSFGEGNFGALFRSIERDQERRGVLAGGATR
ncbi:MAG: 4-hydroxyphenylpyruvate dioxygenase [Deltaproteobacteria bacterium]|nr:4-hydroxyphenylpyruvate dioxygenase [Deltaproteobacteria bacterium]